MSAEKPLDLEFIDAGRRLRDLGAARRQRLAVAVSVGVTVLWLFYVTAAGQWVRVGDRWASAVTMLFGSFVAGSTPQGGGAVAFPVFTKVLEVPAEVARSFSLAIQAIGMGAASLAIIINRRRVEWRAVMVGLPVAIVAFLLAITLLSDGSEPFRPPIVPGPYVKVTFTLVIAAMALVVYLGSRIRVRLVNLEMPPMNRRIYAALVVMAAVGGVAAAFTGSGADVFIYVFLAILLAVDSKVGVPTSVVVMAGVSLLGIVALGVVDGQLSVDLGGDGATVLAVGGTPVFDAAGAGGPPNPSFAAGRPLAAGKADLFGLWLAAVPIVAWGAPLGSWMAARIRTRQLVAFVAVLALAEIVTTVLFLDELRTNPALMAYAVVGAIVVGGGLWLLAARRRSIFELPGVDSRRSLSRGDLDVAEDYRRSLEEGK